MPHSFKNSKSGCIKAAGIFSPSPTTIICSINLDCFSWFSINAGATYLMPKVQQPASLGMNLFLLRCNSDFSPVFIYLNIKSREHSLKALASGTSTKTITKLDVRNFKVTSPPLPEQQKIASFLSAVDKKIEQLTRKKELLEQYKKGVMQKIFSQEIRFKDDNGQDYPDWEEKRLGDVISFHPTNSLSRSDLNYDEGNIYNIHYGDIHKTFRAQFDIDREKLPFISNDNDTKKLKNESFCNPGDLIIADASEDYADIGKVIEIWNVSGKKIVAGLHTFLGRDIKSETVVGFKGYLFQSSLIRKQIYRIAQGISVLGISKKNVLGIQFELPHKGEQTKIVSMLSSIDNKINIVKTQLTHTQNFKKGLLQKMFV